MLRLWCRIELGWNNNRIISLYLINRNVRSICLSFLWVLSFVFCPLLSYGRVINIRSQSDFDRLPEQLISAIKTDGTDCDILVNFFPGVYVSKEGQVLLGWMQAPNKIIRMVGNNTVIIPEGEVYHTGDKYRGIFSYDNSLMCANKDIPIWTTCYEAIGLVEVLNTNTKECRLKAEEGISILPDCTSAFILIPEWCQTGVYKITDIKDGYIYFIADNLQISYNNGYVVNDDYNYGGKSIRYKLCNISKNDDLFRIENGKVCLPEGIKIVREGRISNYITIQSSSFKSIEISGIEFRGNKYVDSRPAIFVCDTKCESISIRDCKFIGMHGTVISIESTDNVNVTNNKFTDCHYYGVYSDNRCKGTIISSNTFTNMGKRMTCSFCITCKGEDYYVANNKLSNFGYGGIGIGVWHGHKQYRPSKGVVENNELFYTEDYLTDVLDKCIMDGGAIYLWTKNDGAIIRNNYIHDISGVMDNRGIFCDDGARNYVIEHNVITNIYNSYCIDSRRVARLETQIGPTNVNNIIRDNIINGEIRFVGREGTDNECEYGTNYYLVNKSGDMPLRNVENTIVSGEEVKLTYTGTKKSRVGLDSKSYARLKKSPVWKHVKRRVVRKNK